jgi:hypothetical protein
VESIHTRKGWFNIPNTINIIHCHKKVKEEPYDHLKKCGKAFEEIQLIHEKNSQQTRDSKKFLFSVNLL